MAASFTPLVDTDRGQEIAVAPQANLGRCFFCLGRAEIGPVLKGRDLRYLDVSGQGGGGPFEPMGVIQPLC